MCILVVVMYHEYFSIYRTGNKATPPIPFHQVKDAVLGKNYSLSLAFVSTEISVQLHKEHKRKSGPANTLAFPFDEVSGEIIMHLGTIRHEARKYNRNYHEHLLFMFIHSCLHLKGYEHGNEMELQEKKYYKKFLTQLK